MLSRSMDIAVMAPTVLGGFSAVMSPARLEAAVPPKSSTKMIIHLVVSRGKR